MKLYFKNGGFSGWGKLDNSVRNKQTKREQREIKANKQKQQQKQKAEQNKSTNKLYLFIGEASGIRVEDTLVRSKFSQHFL